MKTFETLYTILLQQLEQENHVKALSEQFAQAKTDQDRVQLCLSIPQVQSLFQVSNNFNPHIGSIEKIIEFRNRGNNYFKQKKYAEAINYYTKAIWQQEPTCNNDVAQKELSLTFANRSAAWFFRNQFENCRRDIQYAEKRCYPQELKYKLYDRQGKCYQKQQQYALAFQSFEKSLKYLELSNLEESKKQIQKKGTLLQMDTCLNQVAAACSEVPGETLEVCKQMNTSLPLFKSGPSEVFLGASKSFDISSEEGHGRYAVAKFNIEIGEEIIIEKPYASVLLEPHYDTHCENCCKRALTPIPCVWCFRVRYCSDECQQDAWLKYHVTECKILDTVLKSQVGKFGYLALRVVTVTGLKKLSSFNSLSEEEPNNGVTVAGSDNDGIYRPYSYSAIHHLVTHTEDRTVGDLFKRAVMAVFLVKCLECTNFFSGSNDRDKDKEFVGGVILRHLQNLPCNAHEVSELVLNHSDMAASETIEVGAAIYATMSLLNHSCDPSVVRHFYGTTCVVRAIRTITKGTAIDDNYGVLSALTPTHERQDKLKSQYYFICSCQPCLENWPQIDKLSSIRPSMKCQDCQDPLNVGFNVATTKLPDYALCDNCGKTVQTLEKIFDLLSECHDEFIKAVDVFLKGNDYKHPAKVFKQYLEMNEMYTCRPNQNFNSCQEMLKQCYSIWANCSLLES